MAVFIILLTLLQVSSALYGPRLLAGEIGGSITIKCFYPATRANRYDRKYWCKVSEDRRVCNTIISTSRFISEDYRGRASITDSPKNGTFTVRVTQLKWSDTGVYRCGIGANNRALSISMNLTVSEDSDVHQSSELVLGELRGSVTIQCQPENTKGGGRKFWCKLGKNGCVVIADSDGYVRRNYEGRIFFTPEESSGTFKILINSLKKEDSGFYKCGIGKLGDLESTRTIDLQVMEESTIPRAPRFLSGSVGGVVSAKCHYDPERTYEMKYWCRWKEAGCSLVADTNGFVQDAFEGRIQIISNKQKNGIFTVVMRHLEEKDAGWYLCGVKDGHMEQTFSVKLHIQNGPTPSVPVSSSSPMSALHSTTSHVNVTNQTFFMSTVTEEILEKATSEDTFVTFTNPVYDSTTSHVNVTNQTFFMSTVTEEILEKNTSEDTLVTFTNPVYDSTTSHVNVTNQTFFMSTVTEEILEKTTSEDTFVTFTNPVYDSTTSHVNVTNQTFFMSTVTEEILEKNTSEDTLVTFTNPVYDSTTSHVNVTNQTFFMSTVTEEILEKTTSEDTFVTFTNPVYDSTISHVNVTNQTFFMSTVTEEILEKNTSEDTLVTFTNPVYDSITSHVNVTNQTFFMSTVTEEILEKTTSEDTFVTFTNPVYDSSSSERKLLPFVVPALLVLLLLFAIVIFIVIKVKLHKKKVRDRSSVSDLEARVTLTDLKCLEEETMEKNVDPAKQLKPELDLYKESSSRLVKDPGASDVNVQVF